VGVSYSQSDGQKLQSFPGDLDTLEQVQVSFGMHFSLCFHGVKPL